MRFTKLISRHFFKNFKFFVAAWYLLLQFPLQSLQHSSNDVRLTAVKTIEYVARRVPSAIESDTLKVLVPDLLAASRDKNTTIRVMAETALISALALRDGDHKLEVGILSNLETSGV